MMYKSEKKTIPPFDDKKIISLDNKNDRLIIQFLETQNPLDITLNTRFVSIKYKGVHADKKQPPEVQSLEVPPPKVQPAEGPAEGPTNGPAEVPAKVKPPAALKKSSTL